MSQDKRIPLILAIAGLPSDGPELGFLLDLVRHVRFQRGLTLEKLNEILKLLKSKAPGGIESLEFWFGNSGMVEVDENFRKSYPYFKFGERPPRGYSCENKEIGGVHHCSELNIPDIIFRGGIKEMFERSLNLSQLRVVLKNERHGDGTALCSDKQVTNLVPIIKGDKLYFLEISWMFGKWRVCAPEKYCDKTYWTTSTRVLYNHKSDEE